MSEIYGVIRLVSQYGDCLQGRDVVASGADSESLAEADVGRLNKSTAAISHHAVHAASDRLGGIK